LGKNENIEDTMKSQSHSWLDPLIGLLLMTNGLMLIHHLQADKISEQLIQIAAVLLYYTWLSKWAKKL
jgi:hypothetical protein